jgi:hypothetical protein
LKNILEINKKKIQAVIGFCQKSFEFQVRWGMSFGYIFSGNLEEAWKEIEILKNLALEEEKLEWEKQALFTEGFYYAEEGSLDKAQNATDEMKKKIEEGINKYWMRLYFVLRGKTELEQKNFLEAIKNTKEQSLCFRQKIIKHNCRLHFLIFLQRLIIWQVISRMPGDNMKKSCK